jgi:hypothetical protein
MRSERQTGKAGERDPSCDFHACDIHGVSEWRE